MFLHNFLFLALMVTFSSTTIVSAYNLPELGNNNQQVLPIHTEQKLGLMLYQELEQRVPMIHDPLLQDYLQDLGDRLIANANQQPFKFHFFFINHSAINAFTGPGGYIAVHSGLMSAVNNESELAAVLSHEISHATQRHIANGLQQAKLATLTNLGALVAAAAIGAATKNSDAATGALISASALNLENRLGFSRAQEQEADRLGIDLLYRSGYDPNSMPLFLNTLGRIADADRSLVAELLSTHPLTDFRVADTQNRALQFSPKPYRQDNHRFNMMRARIAVLYSPHIERTQRMFEVRLRNTNNADNRLQDRIALRYGHALALMRNGNDQQALNEMQQLHLEEPREIAVALGVAEIYDHQRAYQQATKILQDQYHWYPDYLPLVQQYTDTLLANKQIAKAIEVLEAYLDDHEATPQLHRLIARSYAAKKHMAQAYLHNAQADLSEGRFRSAHLLATQGLRTKSISGVTRRALEEVIARSKELNVPIKL